MLELRITSIIPILTIWCMPKIWASPIIQSQISSDNSLTLGGKNQAALDVRSTIEEVQKMLAQDPNLPRLTRGEIEDLFEQVTKEEFEKSLITGDMTRAKHMRALMLVLPYNTENSNENLEELYNRPPVTKVVSSGEVKPQKAQKTIVPSGKVEIHSMESPTTYKPAFRKKQIETTPTVTTYRPHVDKIKSSTTPTLYITTTANTPVQYQENLQTAASVNSNKFSSHYNAKNSDFNKNFPTEVKSTTKPKGTADLDEILESLGFTAQAQSRKRFKLEELETDEYPKPVISSLIKQDRFSVDEFIPEGLSATDFKKGLIPEIRPEDYVAFKPLPIPKEAPKSIEPEIESYLRMFGIIGEEQGRSGKSLNLDDPTTSTTTTEPLITSSVRPARIKRIDTSVEDGLTSPPPTVEEENLDEEDYVQLHQLLSNIRQLQELNISLTDEAFNRLDLKNYNLSKTLLSQGPDPIQTADLADPSKNEIKRQSDNSEPTRISLELSLDSVNDTLPADVSSGTTNEETTSTTSSPETTSTSTTTATTTTRASTESSRRNGMEDNFAGLDPVTEEPLPAPRKNGFYFLADWNSFLEVGDGPEQVVVRFNPQVGDPSRFIPVTVP